MDSTDRFAAPLPGPPRAFAGPSWEASELASGLELRLARMPRLPLVSAHLLLATGESALGPARAGLAALTGEALQSGTETRTAMELAGALEQIGVQLGVGTGWDATTLSLGCMADRLAEGLALLAEIVRTPSFPDDEIRRVGERRLARVRERAMDPSTLAADETARLVYAEGEPYGRPLVGTEASLAAVEAPAVRDYAERFHRPGGATLIVVGDLEPEEVVAWAERSFAGWAGQAPPRVEIEGRPRTSQRTVHIVDRPGAVQSEIRLAHPSARRDTPDYLPLRVANTVLGGSFVSRLNLNLREQRGFTYGVRSRFDFRRGPGLFSVSTAVETEVTAEAIREALNEVERWVEDGPTAEEVAAARDYIVGVFPLRFETTGQVASRIAEVVLHGLDDDWYDVYRDRVHGVDRDSAHAAARRHVRPDELQVIVVGDAEAVEGPIRELGLGAVQLHEAATVDPSEGTS